MRKNTKALSFIITISLIMTIFLQGCGNTSSSTDSTAHDTETKTEKIETKSEEGVTELKTGTYSNGANNIIIAKNDNGKYSYNLNVYDNTDDFRFFIGSIEKNDSTYAGTIDSDSSERYTDKKFSIAPADDSLTITSDDDDLLFLCMKFKYTSDVDDLEENAGETAEEYISGIVDVEKGDANYKLTQGYYGFWNGETEYIFGVNPDGSFAIDITEGLSSVLHAEGDITDNGDGTYNGTITSSDTDFMKNQSIIVSVLSEDTISIAGSFKMLDDMVHGTYQYAGFKAYDVDSLKKTNSTESTEVKKGDADSIDTVQISDTGFLSSTEIPYVDWTMYVIGADWKQFKDEMGIVAYEGTLTNNSEFLSHYYGLSNEDKSIEWHATKRQYEVYGVRNGKIVAYADTFLMRNNAHVSDIVPEEIANITPYWAHADRGIWLTWKCNNAYISVNPDSNWRLKNTIYDMMVHSVVISEIDDNLFLLPSCEMYSGN